MKELLHVKAAQSAEITPVKFTEVAFQSRLFLTYPSFCSWRDGRTTGQSVWNLQTRHRSVPAVCQRRQSG